MTRLLVLAVLLLTACAPVVSSEVLPAEAQRVIDRATATAGAEATRLANVQATIQSDRATSTAAAVNTHAALAVQQTQVQLQVTQAAIAVGQTQAVASQAYQSTVIAITVEAARNLAIADEYALQQRQDRARDWSAFWRAVGDTVVFIVLMAGGVGVLYIVLTFALTAWTRYLQAKAVIARESFRVLSPGHYADYDPHSGYRVLPLPALAAPQESVIEVAPITPATNWNSGWRRAYRLYAYWGDRFGFGIRDLGPQGVQVVSDPVWRKLHDAFTDKGILDVKVIDRDGKKVRVTTWADNWSLARFVDDYNAGRLVLPLPSKEDPPIVVDFVAPQHSPALPHNTPTQLPEVV